MFAPHHLRFLIKYFDGIDAFVARKLSRPAPSGETTLTEEFCAMMDAGNQRAEGLLSYDLDALNADLASNGYWFCNLARRRLSPARPYFGAAPTPAGIAAVFCAAPSIHTPPTRTST